MIFRQPRQRYFRRTQGDAEETEISSTVETKRTKSDLWFRFPADSSPSTDVDPFVVGLVLLAMQQNEPLEVEGTLSRQLIDGLERYQQVFHDWFPERFHLVKIHVEELRGDVPGATTGGVSACAFSGGVDSFYTLLTVPEITQTIFMSGFDMPLNLGDSISELTGSYSRMMKDFGREFIIGSTNIRQFVNTVNWTNAHGQALAAAALFFKNRWSRFYIPSSYTRGTYPKWGTHPSLDPLLSTEMMEFVHHGYSANRVKKLEKIAAVPASFDRLRVCWIQDIGLKNCGNCEKCMRTMIGLDLLDALPNFSTFAGLSRGKVRAMKLRTYQARLFARELMREAIHRRKFKTVIDLGIALLRREIFYRGIVRSR